MRASLGPLEVYGYHDYGPGEGPFYCGLSVGDCSYEVMIV